MSKIFLVDCENDFNDEFIDLYNLRKGDEVHFFISKNAHEIDGYLINKLKAKEIEYWFEECLVDEIGDIDKCLIAFLGIKISKYPLSGCEFYIVSNKTEYENPVSFIKNTIRGNYSVDYITSFTGTEYSDSLNVDKVPESVLIYLKEFKEKNNDNPKFKSMLRNSLIKRYGAIGDDYFRIIVRENVI